MQSQETGLFTDVYSQGNKNEFAVLWLVSRWREATGTASRMRPPGRNCWEDKEKNKSLVPESVPKKSLQLKFHFDHSPKKSPGNQLTTCRRLTAEAVRWCLCLSYCRSSTESRWSSLQEVQPTGQKLRLPQAARDERSHKAIKIKLWKQKHATGTRASRQTASVLDRVH